MHNLHELYGRECNQALSDDGIRRHANKARWYMLVAIFQWVKKYGEASSSAIFFFQTHQALISLQIKLLKLWHSDNRRQKLQDFDVEIKKK